jgi:hypothetical protein
MEPEEIREIKGQGKRGMTLLGFKPLRWALVFGGSVFCFLFF